jgi:hypothetical protein
VARCPIAENEKVPGVANPTLSILSALKKRWFFARSPDGAQRNPGL